MNQKKLLQILRNNARLNNKEIAAMLDCTEKEVEREIEKLENDRIIIGYSAVVNEEKFDKNFVEALIELRVSPQAENGYDEIAQKIAQYREVNSVRLLSGAYDLLVTVVGYNHRDVALFISNVLAPIDGVISTTTHFILSRYKERGEVFADAEEDDRGLVSP
jgi:DNA-binding Lrp family transcriptional regulator